MKVTIVGSGCKTCLTLEEHTKIALMELSLSATIEKYTDKLGFAELGVLRTPALMVEEEVISQGRLLSVDEIKRLLVEHQ